MPLYEITMKIVPDDGVKLFTGVMKVESNPTFPDESNLYQIFKGTVEPETESSISL